MSNTKNQFQIVGRLHEVFAEQQVSDKFRKREFVLELEGQYPEHVKYQLVQEKCAAIDQFKVGSLLKVDFNLRGRAFTKEGVKTYFSNLEAWRLTAAEEKQSNSQL